MSVRATATQLNTDTALYAGRSIAELLIENETAHREGRSVGTNMGKEDFLKLLAAQLKYQDPLEPVKDSDFSAQLAQFSALEQMQNMNTTLTAMSGYQAYTLIGKIASGQVYVDGVLTDVFGTIDCIFTEKGVTFAQIGEYAVPVSSIKDVYDSSALLTARDLLTASDTLIGRYVKAALDEIEVEGIVTRVTVQEGALYAYIQTESGDTIGVPIGAIYDIRQAAAPGEEEELLAEEDGDGLELDGDEEVETDLGTGPVGGTDPGGETGPVGGSETDTGDGTEP
jgi:hypothetical protein